MNCRDFPLFLMGFLWSGALLAQGSQTPGAAPQGCLDKAVYAQTLSNWIPLLTIFLALLVNWGMTYAKVGTPALRLLLSLFSGAILTALLNDWILRTYLADCSPPPMFAFAVGAFVRGVVYAGIIALVFYAWRRAARDRERI